MLDTTTGATPPVPHPRRRTRLERETTVSYNEQEAYATLWTSSPREMTRWAKLGLVITPKNGGWAALVEKKRIRIAKVRVTSPLIAQAARERLAVARQKKLEKVRAQLATEISAVSAAAEVR